MEAADRLDLSADRGLSEAWDRHAAELYGYAVRVLRDHDEADEALQETFVRAWRSAGRYDASRPGNHSSTLPSRTVSSNAFGIHPKKMHDLQVSRPKNARSSC